MSAIASWMNDRAGLITAGAIVGAVAGIVSRIAMRLIVTATAEQPGFSWAGSIMIVILGAGLGGVLALGYRSFQTLLVPGWNWPRAGGSFSLLLLALMIPYYPFGSRGSVLGHDLLPLGLFVLIPFIYGVGIAWLSGLVDRRSSSLQIAGPWRWLWYAGCILLLPGGVLALLMEFAGGILPPTLFTVGVTIQNMLRGYDIFRAAESPTSGILGGLLVLVYPAVVVTSVLLMVHLFKQQVGRMAGSVIGLVLALPVALIAVSSSDFQAFLRSYLFGIALMAALLIGYGGWLAGVLNAGGEAHPRSALKHPVAILTLLTLVLGVAWLAAVRVSQALQ
jgi:hypothetical protein